MKSRACFNVGIRRKDDGWYEFTGLGRPMDFPPNYLARTSIRETVEGAVHVHLLMQQLD